ncbi:MAG TPA: glycosyltransferase family 2 protein [Candidatus Saccharimonadales bacterium]|nr:glycosyltransferase family 2 protein [Candidatus Saccharimonadales bacterium]
MHKDTCVVVPVYNEASVVAAVVRELAGYFPHIICVNDGSTDASAQVVAKTTASLIEHPHNKGQGAALRTGIEAALRNRKIKYIVTFDADGQHSAADADRMVHYMKQHTDTDVVLGSRFLGEAEDIGAIKLAALKAAIVFSNLISGLKLTDTHNGLRVFNRRFAENLHVKSNGFAHASEIIYKITRHEYIYKELPVTISYTDYSKGKRAVSAQAYQVLKEMLSSREMLKHRLAKSWRI